MCPVHHLRYENTRVEEIGIDCVYIIIGCVEITDRDTVENRKYRIQEDPIFLEEELILKGNLALAAAVEKEGSLCLCPPFPLTVCKLFFMFYNSLVRYVGLQPFVTVSQDDAMRAVTEGIRYIKVYRQLARTVLIRHVRIRNADRAQPRKRQSVSWRVTSPLGSVGVIGGVSRVIASIIV